jgi:hypothetical protein
VLASQGVLGRGTTKQVRKHHLKDKQGLNFIGHSLASRFLFGGISKRQYHDDRKFHEFLRHYSTDARKLLDYGQEVGGKILKFACLGAIGDWQFHHKAGRLTRSFLNVAKKAATINTSGICHLCPAGRMDFPFEDTSMTAAFIAKIHGVEDPWKQGKESEFLRLVVYKSYRGKFFRFDVWHCFHLGIAKEFVASSLVQSLNLFGEGGTAKALMCLLNDSLNAHLQSTNQQQALSFATLTRAKLGWSKAKEWPKGGWQKATDSVVLLRFQLSLLQANESSLDEILQLVLRASRAIDFFFSSCYAHGVWVPAADARAISSAGLCFLQSYQKLASLCIEKNLNRFMQQPKGHALFHSFYSMYEEALNCECAWNPLNDAVPQNEDFVGRLSRSSRRVAQRKVSQRTLQAYLLQAGDVWKRPFQFGKLSQEETDDPFKM